MMPRSQLFSTLIRRLWCLARLWTLRCAPRIYVPYVHPGSNIVFTDAHDASLQQMCLLVFLTVMKRNFGTEPRDESYYWPWSLHVAVCSDFGCLGHDEQSHKCFWMSFPVTKYLSSQIYIIAISKWIKAQS